MDPALSLQSHSTFVPTLQAISDAWREALALHFVAVEVDVRPCPDLSTGEWGLAKRSICGNVEVVDVGGPLNVERADRRNKLETSLDVVCSMIGREQGAFFWGAGATSSRAVGMNAELMPNATTGAEATNNTYYTKMVDGPQYCTQRYPNNLFANLCNLGVADGINGDVIYVDVAHRKAEGKANVVQVLCDALQSLAPQRQVSMCGVFRLEQGSVRAHVMPEFPACDLPTKAEVDQWLQFFVMDAPLVCLSVFHSLDERGMGLRMQHTHFFSEHGHGGHYHFDTTPDTVRYRGYFSVASRVHKIDRANE